MLTLTTLAPLVGFMMITGLCAGFLSGLLGIGGGFLLVPALYYAFSSLGYETPYLMHICVGTSLGVIVPTVLTSARAHYKKDAFDRKIFKSWTPFLILGVGAGVYLASVLSSQNLMVVFACMTLLTGGYMSLSKDHHILSPAPPKGALCHFIASGVGLLTALMGIGGAIVSVPTLTAFNVPIKKAIGTAAGMGVLTSALGVLGFIISGWGKTPDIPLTFGFVNILGAAIIMPASVFSAPYGAQVAHLLERKTLKIFFAVLLCLISARMFYQSGLLTFISGS